MSSRARSAYEHGLACRRAPKEEPSPPFDRDLPLLRFQPTASPTSSVGALNPLSQWLAVAGSRAVRALSCLRSHFSLSLSMLIIKHFLALFGKTVISLYLNGCSAEAAPFRPCAVVADAQVDPWRDKVAGPGKQLSQP